MKRVAIYSRKSIFTGKGESIENQVEMCKDYCNREYRNDVTYTIYEDEGFSGGNINRPKFLELIADVKAKKIDVLICYRLDRISRNVADFSATLEILENNNVEFISINEKFDTSTPMGRAMVYISSVFAQLERETIAERVRDNMMQLAKTGRWLGGKAPFGFISEKMIYFDENYNERSLVKLSNLEEEMNIIKLIYSKYLETQSITQVVNYLQDNMYKGKNGGEWATPQVQRILSSPLYVESSEETHAYLKSLGMNVYGEANGHGYLTYNKTRKMIFERDVTEWILAVGKHDGVIDADTWLRVQSILEKNKHKKVKRLGTGKSNDALLTGVLKCAKCGANMTVKQGHSSKTENGKRYDYYVCSAKDSSRGKKCDNKNIRVDKLDKIIIEQINTYNKDYLCNELNNLLDDLENNDNNNSNNKLTKLKNDIDEKETSISNLVKQLSAAPNEIVSNYIMNEITKLSNEITNLKKQLKSIKDNKREYDYDLENLKLVVSMLENFSTSFNITDDITQRRLMLQTIIKSAIWNGETYEADITILEDKKKIIERLANYANKSLLTNSRTCLSYLTATFWNNIVIHLKLIDLPSDCNSIADYLRCYRKLHNLSRRQLEINADISLNSIKKYEDKHIYPTKEVSIKLAKYFKLDTKYFHDDFYEQLENINIGKILKDFRGNNTYKDTASIIGVCYHTWIEYENNIRSISRANFYKIKKLGII